MESVTPERLRSEVFVLLSPAADVPSMDSNQFEAVSIADESFSISVDFPRDPVVDQARENRKDGSVSVEPE